MIRSFLIYLPSIIVARGGAFLIIFAATHLMEPAAFGYFSLVMLIGEFADQAAMNWIRVALTRFGAVGGGMSRAFAIRILRVLAICGIAAVLAVAAVAAWLAPERAATVTLAAVAYVAAITVVRFGLTLNQTVGAAGRASVLETVRSLAVFGLSLAGLMATGDFLVPSLLASAGNLAVGLVAVAMGFAAADSSLPDTVPMRRVIVFALPLVLLTILSQVIAGLDKALLKTFGSAAALGVYMAAFAVGRSGFDVIGLAFNQGAFVRLAGLWNAGRQGEANIELRRQLALLMAAFLPAAGTLLSTRDSIALALFSEPYRAAFHDSIPWIALGAIALNVKYFVFDNIFHMHERNLRQIPTFLAGAATSVALAGGLSGMAPATAAAQMFAGGSVAALVVTVVMSRGLARIGFPAASIAVAGLFGLAVEAVGMVLRNELYDVVPPAGILVIVGTVGLLAMMGSVAAALVIEAPDREGLALSLVSTDPDRITGISSYAASLFPAIARASGGPVTVFTNVDPALLADLDKVADLKLVRLPRRPRWVPFKLYEPLVQQGAVLAARLMGARSFLVATPVGALVPVIDQIVTIHDFYDFDPTQRPLRSVLYARALWRWSALVSRLVICVSDATRAEAAALMPGLARRWRVVKEASKFAGDPDASAPAERRDDFLMVANIQPNKNVEGLLDALALAEREGRPLVVRWVGSDHGGLIARWADSHRMPEGFVPLGVVSDADLRAALQAAAALVVPSRKEGFCLPVLEAQTLGTPVVASDIPVLREVAGAGALFVPLDDPKALADALALILTDPDLRARLSEAGRANARGFSWDRAAAETLALVESLQEPAVAPAGLPTLR